MACSILLLKRFNAAAGADLGDLLMPFVSPHAFIVSVILTIAGRSFFSLALFSLVGAAFR